jgi:hypothetical protein
VFTKCIHGFSNFLSPNEKKENHVGIKHFPTNRIRMVIQVFLDEDHRVLIVPLLTADTVCNWEGGSYDAIVLVNDDNLGSSAQQV